MNLEALNIFCDVVRHQSFSRGASANSVSQSAASQTVRQLEKRLGTQLIDRSKRPWQLTPEGELFFKGSQEIVERFHELEEVVQRRKQPSGYTVRLASIYSVQLHDLSQFIEQFRRSIPGVDVNLEYMHPDQIYLRVLKGQSDLGLISFANPGRELTAIPWQEQKMVVACLPNHPFAHNRARLSPQQLNSQNCVTFSRGLTVRREIDRFLRRHHTNVRIVAEFDNIETIKQAIEDGAGIAVLPEPTLRREVQRGTLVKVSLQFSDDDTPFVRPLSIIHRRKRHLNPAVVEFINLLCHRSNIEHGNFQLDDSSLKTDVTNKSIARRMSATEPLR